MEHNETEQTTSTPAGADADVVCTEPCVFGIMSAEPGDAAGRLVKEGAKIYRYGYLDKVRSVTDGDVRYAYGYTATPMTAFGDTAESQPSTLNPQPLFTGKPLVNGLGHAFLFRNYRAGLGKWLTADPLGYPDGWNQLAYCGNDSIEQFDFMGAKVETGTATWDWRYRNEFKDVWTGFAMVLQCNIFTVTIHYHIVVANHTPVIVVDSTDTRFECKTSDSWSLSTDIPITVRGVSVDVGASIGYSYRFEETVYDPIYTSDDKYNYVSQTYKFDIYSYNWVNVFGHEYQFFDKLESWTDVVLVGKCRKE